MTTLSPTESGILRLSSNKTTPYPMLSQRFFSCPLLPLVLPSSVERPEGPNAAQVAEGVSVVVQPCIPLFRTFNHRASVKIPPPPTHRGAPHAARGNLPGLGENRPYMYNCLTNRIYPATASPCPRPAK
jgi:hypothetical protein